jgi:glycosyltransferase involved in cell wall biosynthesis
LLAAKDRAIKTAILARWLCRSRIRLVGRLGTNVSAALEGKGWLRRGLWQLGMRVFYRHADAIVCVSAGVAEDVRRITGLPAERIVVVRNPVVTPQLRELANQPADHPWLAVGQPPVILGVGRLTVQKDFATLIRAFARLRAQRDVRLIILGEGRLRAALESLASKLGVADAVDMPGFKSNPYAYMSRAAVFVLSSRWEGSPNVLTEALALGRPVVATDCPSGPNEILQGGKIAPLVPIGDVARIADAIGEIMDAPPRADSLRAAVDDYFVERSVDGYLAAMAWNPSSGARRIR